MKKIKNFIHTMRNILFFIFTGAFCAIIPIGIMYGGNQTSKSRIEQYGIESPQGIEALKISKIINIVCGIIIGIIVIYTIVNIIKVLLKKIDPATYYDNVNNGGYDSNYDETIKEEENIWGEKVYKNSHGDVVAKVEKGLFGDEIVRDSNNMIIGKGTYNSFTGKTNYQNNNYNDIVEKKTNSLGNNIIKTSDGTVYEEENNIFGSKLNKK